MKKIEIAKQALLKGSQHVLNLFGKSMKDIGTEYKPEEGDTPRTLIDTYAENSILKIIKDSGDFENYEINAEESGTFGKGSNILYIDPYDGTSNAQIKLPMSTMGIGISEEGSLTGSVILNPFENKLYWAEKGEGAFVEDFSKGDITQLGTDTISDSAKQRYAWVDALFNDKTTQRKLEWIAKMQEKGLIQNVRMTGSNIDYSSKIAEARGHYQLTDAVGGFFDLCGYNLVEEAGGRMVNLEGKEPTPKDQVVIAVANPIDLETVLDITNQCYKDYEGFK